MRAGGKEITSQRTVRFARLLAMLALFVGLLTPFAAVQAATPQSQTPSASPNKVNLPPFPSPAQVVVVGDFQSALGCDAWSKDCGPSQLSNDGTGFWSGTFDIPAGTYAYRILTRSDIDRSLGQGADPDGGDFSITVPDGAQTYFSFNQSNGDIAGGSILPGLQAVDDFGNTTQFVPAPGGGYEVYISAQGGIGVQVLLDGNVTDSTQVSIDGSGYAHVQANEGGGITNAEGLVDQTLIVSKVDENGNPVPGSCFSVEGNGLVGQGCDADNGEDGTTIVTFPRGVVPGSYSLTESRTPDGVPAGDNQQVDLTGGQTSVTVQVSLGGGEVPGETPTEEVTEPPVDTPTEEVTEPSADTFSLSIFSVDENNNPLTGACFSIDGVGEQCDDDGDSVVTFTGLQNGDYTVNETTPPSGYNTANPQSVTIDGQDVQIGVTFSVEQTEAPQEFGTLVVTTVDENGNQVAGACFNIKPRPNSTGSEANACDADDGINDGVTTFANAVAGSYRLMQTQPPDGFDLAKNKNVDVPANDTNQVTITQPATGAGPAEEPTQTPENTDVPTETPESTGPTGAGAPVYVSVTDADGFAVIGACVSLNGPQNYQACDNDQNDADGQDGLILFPEVAPGDYVVSNTSVPNGYEAASDQNLTVPSDSTDTINVVLSAGTPVPETGSISVSTQDQNGPLEGACYTVDGSNAVCDGDNSDGDNSPGVVVIDGVAPGSHSVEQSQAPSGYDVAEPQNVDVAAGEQASLTFTNTLTPPPAGSIAITTVDGQGAAIEGACYTVDGNNPVCDGDANDGNGTAGVVLLTDVAPGSHSVEQSTTPNGYDPVDPQIVDVTEGQQANLTFTNSLTPPPTGNLAITTQDGNGTALGGACYSINSGDSICDNQDGDADSSDGVIRIEGIGTGNSNVEQTQAPSGYQTAASQSVDIVADQDASLTFTNEAISGRVYIVTRDADGNDLGGACYTLTGPQTYTVCDNDATDTDADPGQIRLTSVATGDYSASQTTTPDGYLPPDDQTTTVTADEVSRLDFQNALATGTIAIVAQDEQGVAINGVCYSVSGGDQICDDDNNGDVTVDLAAGNYAVSVASVPAGYDVPGDPQNVTVTPGETANLTFTLTVRPGAIAIDTTDGNGQPIANACASVDGGTPVCDNDGNDADTTEGRIQINGIAPGTHTVTITSPDGFEPVADQQVDVASDQTASLSIQFILIPLPTDTPTEVPTETATALPTETPTETATALPTETPTELPTETATALPTETPTETATALPTETPTEQATEAPTETPTVEPTQEPASPTAEVTQEPASPTAEITPEPATGSMQIVVKSDDGTEILAGCFVVNGTADAGPICDNDSSDASPAVGSILINGLPAGDYTVVQQSAADGYGPAAPVAATVAVDETVAVDITNTATAPELGSVRAVIQDSSGTAIGGGCVTIAGTEYCDNGPEDSDPANGVIVISGIIAGPYTVTLSTSPAGYGDAAPVDVTVPANDVVEATFTVEPLPVETGGLQIQLQDQEGNPAPGSCVVLSGGPNGDFLQTYCDNGDGDTNPADGTIVVEGLDVGVYEVTQTPENSDVVSAAEAKTLAPSNAISRTVSVQANITIIVIIIIIINDNTADLVIVKTDQNNQLLGGACFTATGPDGDTLICDNDPNDGNSTLGIISFLGLTNGNYTVKESTTPPGYQTSADQNVTLNGVVQVLTFKNLLPVNPKGTLVVHKVDGKGDPLAGACFELRDSGDKVIAGPICDKTSGANNDGNADGTLRFENVPIGTYSLVETAAPSPDYQLAPAQTVTISSGIETPITVTNQIKLGRVQIAKRDNQNNPLAGACFQLVQGAYNYEICDNQAGDANPAPGVIRFVNIPPGTYTLQETVAPPGFQAAADQQVTVTPDKTTFLTVKDQPLPTPTTTGTLVIKKTGPDNKPLPGACFSLRNGATTVVPSTCDNADGVNDGTITFKNVPTGTYTLHETVKPSANYQTAPDRQVTIGDNQTATVTVQNIYRTGSVRVQKVDQQNNPIQGACFDLAVDGKGPQCSNAAGEINFTNLQPGTYKLTETVTPPGYLTAPVKTNIVVNPGLTTTVTIVDKKAPPPPNSGSIRVIKFFCTSGTGDSYVQFYDSSDGVANPLQKTAGCKKGDATFTVSPKGGGKGLTFNTGADGEAQVVLKAGTYVIAEKGQTKSEEFKVAVGQQTTIVILNFSPPPKPAPVKIVVTKFTCDPGYQGTYYADFVANCLSDANLTNNVTFRVTGSTNVVHKTGDGGQKGVTVFANLVFGTYTLSEDAPANTTTVYGFCGPTPDTSTQKTVNSNMVLNLKQGETAYCGYFNVPDDVSDSRGAIQVQKFTCSASTYPAGFDYEANCPAQAQGTKFALSQWDGTKYVPKLTGTTNADGILRFNQLQPGTYSLKEVGGTWCHAESDNVNAKGDVIVKAGQRTTIWIYNCVPPKEYPNTGTGTTVGPAPTYLAPAGVLFFAGILPPEVWAGGLAPRLQNAA